MKRMRFGAPGQERPCILDRQGSVRDVSMRVSDWAGEALDPAWLAAFSATDIASFPVVPATALGGRRIWLRKNDVVRQDSFPG
jgi:hypothetical protein